MAMTIGSKAGKMAARVVAGLGLIVLVLLVPGLLRPANGNTPFVMTNMRGHPGLSVMTYNIEGCPGRSGWAARRRSPRSARLEALRLLGEQPHIVVLQEAFTDQAKRIGVEGGYRYIVNGPARSLAGARSPPRPTAPSSARRASSAASAAARSSIAASRSCPTIRSCRCGGWPFLPAPASIASRTRERCWQ
ncbi:hypothetical protein ACFSTI_01610 [Rhizorhabdus histidinilytica]